MRYIIIFVLICFSALMYSQDISSFISYGIDFSSKPIKIIYSDGKIANIEYDQSRIKVEYVDGGISTTVTYNKINGIVEVATSVSPYTNEYYYYKYDENNRLIKIAMYSNKYFSYSLFNYSDSRITLERIFYFDTEEKKETIEVEIINPQSLMIKRDDTRRDSLITITMLDGRIKYIETETNGVVNKMEYIYTDSMQ